MTLSMPVLYCNRESGHSYKVALALSLIWSDQAGVDLAAWPAVQAWLDRICALPGWRVPYDLLQQSPPILTGTRT